MDTGNFVNSKNVPYRLSLTKTRSGGSNQIPKTKHSNAKVCSFFWHSIYIYETCNKIYENVAYQL